MTPQQRVIWRNFAVPSTPDPTGGPGWSARPPDLANPAEPRLPSLHTHVALFAGLLALLLALLVVMLYRMKHTVAPSDVERSEGAESSGSDSPQFV